MKLHSIQKTLITTVLLASFAALSASADELVLWDIKFKDLQPGQVLAEVPFSPGCTGPQRVMQSQENGLVGAQAVGTLSPALLYTKATSTNYTPSFILRAQKPYTTGIITISFDITFDRITPSEAAVETLMAFPFMNALGGSDYVVLIAREGPGTLVVSGANLKKGSSKTTFKINDVAHFKMVLDLNKHSFQTFVNEVPMSDEEQSDTKFNSFLGFTVRDGTALGGNHGTAFSAGIANLLVKQD